MMLSDMPTYDYEKKEKDRDTFNSESDFISFMQNRSK